MDIDVFPNILDYWGPNGMVFFRNVQVRWSRLRARERDHLALERPGAGNGGSEQLEDDRTALIGRSRSRFPAPDVLGEFGDTAVSGGTSKRAAIFR